jgi:hypothetical protein
MYNVENPTDNIKYDLNEPIFKMFINGTGHTEQMISEILYGFKNSMHNLQVIYIIADISDFSCVWRGYKYEKMLDERIDVFLEDLNYIISQEEYFQNDVIYKIQMLVRNLKLLILNDI